MSNYKIFFIATYRKNWKAAGKIQITNCRNFHLEPHFNHEEVMKKRILEFLTKLLFLIYQFIWRKRFCVPTVRNLFLSLHHFVCVLISTQKNKDIWNISISMLQFLSIVAGMRLPKVYSSLPNNKFYVPHIENIISENRIY